MVYTVYSFQNVFQYQKKMCIGVQTDIVGSQASGIWFGNTLVGKQ